MCAKKSTALEFNKSRAFLMYKLNFKFLYLPINQNIPYTEFRYWTLGRGAYIARRSNRRS